MRLIEGLDALRELDQKIHWVHGETAESVGGCAPALEAARARLMAPRAPPL